MLPLVLQANGQDPEWFDLPSELILEVEILHPKYLICRIIFFIRSN